MFEFAISQHRKNPPTRLFLSSATVSAAAHLLTFALLLEYPWLLGPGLSHWIRLSLTASSSPLQELEPRDWRLVGFSGTPEKMKGPSEGTLRAMAYDWNAAAKPPSQTIRVQWGKEEEQTAENARLRPTRPVPGREEPKPVAPPNPEPSPAEGIAQTGAERGAETGGLPDKSASGSTPVRTVYLPAPVASIPPKQAPDLAPDSPGLTAPAKIPDGTQPAPAARAANPPQQTRPPATRVFQDEKAALRTDGSGLFDTKGFPLGDYANLIIERVKGNWYIPSNLKESQGHTTVIFFITKDGRYSDARIVLSSGSRSLDLAALNAILVSNPFPPLPQGFPGEQVGAKFVFSYNERP